MMIPGRDLTRRLPRLPGRHGAEAPSWPWTATPWNWSARNCWGPKRRNDTWWGPVGLVLATGGCMSSWLVGVHVEKPEWKAACPFTLFVAAFWQPPATRLFEVSQSSVPETNCGNAVLTSVDTRYRHLQPVSVCFCYCCCLFSFGSRIYMLSHFTKGIQKKHQHRHPIRLPQKWLKGYSRLHLHLSRNNDFHMLHMFPQKTSLTQSKISFFQLATSFGNWLK